MLAVSQRELPGQMLQFTLSWLRSVFAPRQEATEILKEYLPLREGELPGSDLTNSAIEFWFNNRPDGDVPDWSCFKPERHPGWLANVILYERVDGCRYMTRLVGDAIIDYLPENPVGQFLDEVIPEDRLRDVAMRLDRTFSDRLPNYVEKAKVWRHSGSSFDYTALSLPFISRDTGAERVFCILEFDVERLDLRLT